MFCDFPSRRKARNVFLGLDPLRPPRVHSAFKVHGKVYQCGNIIDDQHILKSMFNIPWNTSIVHFRGAIIRQTLTRCCFWFRWFFVLDTQQTGNRIKWERLHCTSVLDLLLLEPLLLEPSGIWALLMVIVPLAARMWAMLTPRVYAWRWGTPDFGFLMGPELGSTDPSTHTNGSA